MKAKDRKRIKMSILIVVISGYFLFEIVMGYKTNSIALISDSYNMLSNLISVVIGLVCLVLSNKTWHKSTFGWARAEVMGALVNSVFMMTISINIFTNSIVRLVQPEDIRDPWMLLGVGVGGLLVDGFGLLLFVGDTKDVEDEEYEDDSQDSENYSVFESSTENEVPSLSNQKYYLASCPEIASVKESLPEVEEVSVDIEELDTATLKSGGTMNIQALLLHIFGGFLGSVVVVTSALVVLFADFKEINRVDPILSLLMLVAILLSTLPLFKQSARVMLQSLPDKMDVPKLTNDLRSQIKGLRGIHDMHVWQLVGSKLIASLHINCKDVTEYENLSVQLRKFFHRKGICSTTIQPEFTERKPSNKKRPSSVNMCYLDSNPKLHHSLSTSNLSSTLNNPRDTTTSTVSFNLTSPTTPIHLSSSTPQLVSVDLSLADHEAPIVEHHTNNQNSIHVKVNE